MSELESLLYKLFSEYSILGANYKQSYLRINKLTELCNDSQILTKSFKAPQLQLLFHASSNRNPNISFPMFCDLIPKLAEARYPAEYSENPSLAFEKLINEHFMPLIRSLTDKTSVVRQEDLAVPNSITLICMDLHRAFREIYTKTFPWEVKPTGSIEELASNSLKALEKILKEFDVYPTIINKTKVHGIWRDIVIMKDSEYQAMTTAAVVPKKFSDLGAFLTLSKFILVFYYCSVYGTQENLVNEDSYSEKFLVMLERVQLSLSKAWKSINLVPSPDVLSNIMQHEGGVDLTALDDQPLDESLMSEVSLDHEGINVIDKNYQALQKIFSDYCAIGDGSNTKFLRNVNYHKLLKDCGILSEEKFNASMSTSQQAPVLFPVDADLIYTRLTSSKRRVQGTMDFLQFLKALELITKKLFPDEPYIDALNRLIEEKVLWIQQDLNKSNQGDIREIIENLKDEAVIEALGIVHRSMIYFYRTYADKNGRMPFEKFLKFCKDFDIFPTILTKSRLSQIFLTLSSLSEEPDLENQSVSSASSAFQQTEGRGNTIDQHLFVEALAVIACEVPYPDNPNSVERICYLIERMSQSDGPAIVYRENGHTRSSVSGEIHDMLVLLKNRYPRILEHSKPEKPGFQELAARYKASS